MEGKGSFAVATIKCESGSWYDINSTFTLARKIGI